MPDQPSLVPRPDDPIPDHLEAEDGYGEYFAWLDAELEAGREEIPPEAPAPRALIALGEAADVDLAMLARMTGPDGLAGLGFAQDAMTDAMCPGPLLHALTAGAATDLSGLNDNEEMGAISAARRLQAHAAWLELTAIADYAARNEARYQASVARGDKRLRRDGEYAREALGMELNLSPRAATDRMELALDLAARLPATFAGLRDGGISERKAAIVHNRTSHLSAQDAATADAILAEAAPGRRPESLDRKACRLARKLDPDYARRVKDDAKSRRRVEARQEPSGNASLAGRELDPAEVLALMSDIKAEALRLREAGMTGTLEQIMTTVYIDRLARRPATGGNGEGGGGPSDSGPGGDGGSGGGNPAPQPGTQPGTDGGRGRTPVPAVINMLVPAGTLLGFSDAMGEANGWLLDPDDSRALVEAASMHPQTRWCVTAVDDKGEAVAHGCSAGQHPWTAPAPGIDSSPGARVTALLRNLKVRLEPIAKGTCDHRHREDQYEPSRKLRHLINARTSTCPAPGCGAQAIHNEGDHTDPWPRGDTCEHNISPPCPRHHHAKHAPGWKLDQPQPGHMKWTVPGGRNYTTGPTRYEI
ncbi:MAG: DUF222 domain-containing protein [Trebonia sp.]